MTRSIRQQYNGGPPGNAATRDDRSTMLRFGSLALLLLLGPALSAAQAPAQTPASPSPAERAEEAFARGVALHQASDILGAIEAYEDSLALEPDRIEARSNLGAAFVRLGRYEQAIEQYRKALQLAPGNATIAFNLALALYKASRTPEAAEELQRVVDRDRSHRNATLLLADCLLQMGQDRRVIDLLAPLEASLGQDRLFAYLLGTALVQQDEVTRGQVLIDRLFQGGDSAEARLLLGAQHLRRRDFPAAITELKRAIELNPGLPTVHGLYGRALMASGNREGAGVEFRREVEGNPTDFESNLFLGLLRKDDDRLDEALDYLKRAARLRPQDPRVLYGLGNVHVAAGRLDAAREVLETLVKEAPAYQQGHVLLAKVYYRQKRKDLGDRERAIVEKLDASAQAAQPGASDALGPAYRGTPAAPVPEPSPKEKRKPGGTPEP
jgi:tetratricopeptide (TPR) repeat protein